MGSLHSAVDSLNPNLVTDEEPIVIPGDDFYARFDHFGRNLRSSILTNKRAYRMAQDKELPVTAVEIATLRLALAALTGYLLVDDPDEANDAIDALIARIDRMARSGITA